MLPRRPRIVNLRLQKLENGCSGPLKWARPAPRPQPRAPRRPQSPEAAQRRGAPRTPAASVMQVHHLFYASMPVVQLQTVRSQLYRSRFLRPNTHFAAFFEIYKILAFLYRLKLIIFKKLRNFQQKSQNFDSNFAKFLSFERCKIAKIL